MQANAEEMARQRRIDCSLDRSDDEAAQQTCVLPANPTLFPEDCSYAVDRM